MSAHTLASTLRAEVTGGIKKAVVTVTGSASYDTGGSTLDLSSIFTLVYGVNVIAISPHASGKYNDRFIPGASYAPSTGKIKLYDTTTDPGAEVSSTTDLSATTFTIEVTGT